MLAAGILMINPSKPYNFEGTLIYVGMIASGFPWNPEKPHGIHGNHEIIEISEPGLLRGARSELHVFAGLQITK